LSGAEAGPSIKPVIISELVDLDPLGIAGRLHLQRHGASGQKGGGASSLRDNSGTSEPGRGEPQKKREEATGPTATRTEMAGADIPGEKMGRRGGGGGERRYDEREKRERG
jgi:hypothetical protein